MSNEKQALTEEQRAALKPLFDKLESAYYEVEEAVAAVFPRDDPDGEFGFCFSCPRPGKQKTCSSFVGPGKTCQRDFCGHPILSHW